MQDGIFHRKVSVFSCNRENCDFLYSKLLTCILRSAILKLLGQSLGLPHFYQENLLRGEVLIMGAAGSEAEELRHCAAVSPEHKAVGNISGKPPAQEQRRKEGSCPHTASDLIELAVQIVAHGHQENGGKHGVQSQSRHVVRCREGDGSRKDQEDPAAQRVHDYVDQCIRGITYAGNTGQIIENADDQGEGQENDGILEHTDKGVWLHQLQTAIHKLESAVKGSLQEGGEGVGGSKQDERNNQGLHDLPEGNLYIQLTDRGQSGRDGLAALTQQQLQQPEQSRAAQRCGYDHVDQPQVSRFCGKEAGHDGIGRLEPQGLAGTEIGSDKAGDGRGNCRQNKITALQGQSGRIGLVLTGGVFPGSQKNSRQSAEESQKCESRKGGEGEGNIGACQAAAADRLGRGIGQLAVVVAECLGEEFHGAADGLRRPEIAVVMGGGIEGEIDAAAVQRCLQAGIFRDIRVENGAQQSGLCFRFNGGIRDLIVRVALHRTISTENLHIPLVGLGEPGGGSGAGAVALSADHQVGVHRALHFFNSAYSGFHGAAVVVHDPGCFNIPAYNGLLLLLHVLIGFQLPLGKCRGGNVIGVFRQLLLRQLHTEFVVKDVQHPVIERVQLPVGDQYGTDDGIGLRMAPHTDPFRIHIADGAGILKRVIKTAGALIAVIRLAVLKVVGHIRGAGAVHIDIEHHIAPSCVFPCVDTVCGHTFRSAVTEDHAGKLCVFGNFSRAVQIHGQIRTANLQGDVLNGDLISLGYN